MSEGSGQYGGSYRSGINPTALGATLILDNTLWVAKNGNNNNGTRGKPGLPYLDIQAAADDAQAGDCVIICPGEYDENDLLRTNVDYYFFPGARVNYTGIDTVAIFDDNGISTINLIIGGEFILTPTSGTGQSIIKTSNLTTVLSLNITSLSTPLNTLQYAILNEGGTHLIIANVISSNRIRIDTITTAVGTILTCNTLIASLELVDQGNMRVICNGYGGNAAFDQGIVLEDTSRLTMRATIIRPIFTNANTSRGFMHFENSTECRIQTDRMVGATTNNPIISTANEGAAMDLIFEGEFINDGAGGNAFLALLAQNNNITIPANVTFRNVQGRVNGAPNSITTNGSGNTADIKGLSLYVNKSAEAVNIVLAAGTINVNVNT